MDPEVLDQSLPEQQVPESPEPVEAAPAPAERPQEPAAEPEAPKSLEDAIDRGLDAVNGDDVDEEGIPNVGERARERYRELIRARKEAEEKLSALEVLKPLAEQHQQMMLGLAELNIDTQTWQNFFNFATLARSNRPEDAQKALQIIEAQRRMLADRLVGSGVEVPGYDPLDAHPDLKARVESFDLTREDAMKLARLEAMERARNQPPPRQPVQQPQPQTRQDFSPEALESARTELNALHAELVAKDPDFHKVYPALQQAAGRILVSSPREQWAPLIRQAYMTLKTEAARSSRQGAPRQRPIPSTPAGGIGAGTPKSLRDAISAGLDSVRRQ
jgi:hypothetical protein